MKFNFKSALLAATAVSSIAMVVPAQADVISYTVSFSSLTQSGGTSFNLFNTSLGTLTQVQVIINPTVSYNTNVVNNQGTTISGTEYNIAAFTFSSTTSGLILNMEGGGGNGVYDSTASSGHPAVNTFTIGQTSFPNTPNPNTEFSNSASLSILAGQTETFSGTLQPSTSLDYSTEITSGLSLWEQAGGGLGDNLTETSNLQANVNFTGGGTSINYSITPGASAGQTFEIVYTYTAPPPPPPPPPTGAPEPASMLLMGAGLAGLGAVVRRKRRT